MATDLPKVDEYEVRVYDTQSGRRLVAATQRAAATTALGADYLPFVEVIDERSFVNAIVGLMATGGSTNHVIHLVAMARACGPVITWEDMADISRVTPLLARVYPNGAFMAFLANPPAAAPRYDLVAAKGSDTARATHVIRYATAADVAVLDSVRPAPAKPETQPTSRADWVDAQGNFTARMVAAYQQAVKVKAEGFGKNGLSPEEATRRGEVGGLRSCGRSWGRNWGGNCG